MMSAVFVDTSFVIALLNTGDPYHEKAKQLLVQISQPMRPRLTTIAVLLELGDGFARKGRWDLISPFLARVPSDDNLEVLAVDRELLQRARLLRDSRTDKDWSLTDCVSFTVMKERGLNEALTADRHFQQAGFRALLLEP